MNRRVARKDIEKIITNIRKAIPGIALRTSIIVGFPGETEKEFEELLDFIKEVKFERMGAFSYSREEGTPAYDFKGQVPEKIKSKRLDLIMSTQRDISVGLNNDLKGKTLEILIDEEDNGSYLGRTQSDAPEVDGLVYVKSLRALKPGDFVKVKINDTLEYDLVGEVVK
jgi:ribosomal protein S12 methylthiotransferase